MSYIHWGQTEPPEVARRNEHQLPIAVTHSLMHPVLAFLFALSHFPTPLPSWDCLPDKVLAHESFSQGLLEEPKLRNLEAMGMKATC